MSRKTEIVLFAVVAALLAAVLIALCSKCSAATPSHEERCRTLAYDAGSTAKYLQFYAAQGPAAAQGAMSRVLAGKTAALQRCLTRDNCVFLNEKDGLDTIERLTQQESDLAQDGKTPAEVAKKIEDDCNSEAVR